MSEIMIAGEWREMDNMGEKMRDSVAEILKDAGWRDTNDAQWSGLLVALPKLQALLSQPSQSPERYEALGYALAMRVLQSDLYQLLDDKQRAECDEITKRGMQPEGFRLAPIEFYPEQEAAKEKPVSEQNARFAIDAAIDFGKQGINRPPSKDHWLMPFWMIGKKLAAPSVSASQTATEQAMRDFATTGVSIQRIAYEDFALPSQSERVSADFDAWKENPYTKVLEKSIREDYIPRADAAQVQNAAYDHAKTAIKEAAVSDEIFLSTAFDAIDALKSSPQVAQEPANSGQIINGVFWPPGYCIAPNRKIIPPAGKHEDYTFGYNIGYADGLQDEHLYTYTSRQATHCAGCGEYKHTPLRIDAMGGYVCLTCIGQKLGSLLGEFGYSQESTTAQRSKQEQALQFLADQAQELGMGYEQDGAVGELPPLPGPSFFYSTVVPEDTPTFTAEQMRGYARAALSASQQASERDKLDADRYRTWREIKVTGLTPGPLFMALSQDEIDAALNAIIAARAAQESEQSAAEKAFKIIADRAAQEKKA